MYLLLCNFSHGSSTPSTPRKELKVSLSEYQTERSLSLSGEETPVAHRQSVNSSSGGSVEDIQSTVLLSRTIGPQNPQTSTPVHQNVSVNINQESGAVEFSPMARKDTGSTISTGSSVASSERPSRRSKRVSFIDPLNVRVPVVGFEVMEQRAKFTVRQFLRKSNYMTRSRALKSTCVFLKIPVIFCRVGNLACSFNFYN